MLRPQFTLGIAALACFSLILCAAAADPRKPAQPRATAEGKTGAEKAEPTPVEPPAPGETDEVAFEEDKGPWEVTDRVELIFKQKLESAGDQTIAAKVLLKNTSEAEIPGKIVLVIDGTSIEGTSLHAPQGQFSETTPYLQMLPAKRVLDVGKETPQKTVILTTTESTKNLQLESASLRWRVFTLTKPADLETGPPADEKLVPGKGYTWGEMRKVMAIQEQAMVGLVEKHNGAILGTGTSEDANGNLVIRVYAAQGGMSRKIPGTIEGIPVELTVTGVIKGGPAYSQVIIQDGKAIRPTAPIPETPGAPTPEASTTKVKSPQATQNGPPTLRFNRPVPIGVSTINQTDVCASGTLGCRCISRNGKYYILSNNHVLAKENAGVTGNPICQPGKLDLVGVNQCKALTTDVIANLADFQPLQYFSNPLLVNLAPINTMDAAIAEVITGSVDVATPTEGYGIPSRNIQENLTIGLPVQKYGRTTAFTKGKVFSTNVSTFINYGNNRLARFRYCIDIQTPLRTPAFGAPGDSGSLVVTVADRRPIGLLFAGGGYDTFLNPISPVLTRFKVGVDDGTGSAPILGSGRMGTAIGPAK